MNQSKEKSKLTIAGLKKRVGPRPTLWYERSFSVAFGPVALAICIFYISRLIDRDFFQSPYNVEWLFVLPLIIIAAVYQRADEKSDEMGVLYEQLKNSADGFKEYITDRARESYLRAINTFVCHVRPDVQNDGSIGVSCRDLHKAFRAEELDSDVVEQLKVFLEAYCVLASEKLRSIPTAIRTASIVLMSVPVIVSAIQAERFRDYLITLFAVYGISLLYFLARNRAQFFGPLGSQYSVAELRDELLEGLKET